MGTCNILEDTYEMVVFKAFSYTVFGSAQR